jgi:transcriptional regulator with XRE-family HTH domain
MATVEWIGERVRNLRLKADLTQQQLAELIDSNEKFIQQIERHRKKEIWVSTVAKIADAFGMDLPAFFAPELPEVVKAARPVAPREVHRRNSSR